MLLSRETKAQLVELLLKRGYSRLPRPAYKLSSGAMTAVYIDGKKAMADGAALHLIGKSIIDVVGEQFDAIGGPTMGADPMAHAVAMLCGCRWFSITKGPKTHGLATRLKGDVRQGDRVVFVDDVVSSGKSLCHAIDLVLEIGVEPVAACAILDRGLVAKERVESRDMRYLPLLTWADVKIEPLA